MGKYTRPRMVCGLRSVVLTLGRLIDTMSMWGEMYARRSAVVGGVGSGWSGIGRLLTEAIYARLNEV